MSDYPRSLREFEARFPDDEACARWLSKKRWPDGFCCPACGHGKGFELGRGVLMYQCAGCRKQTSVTAGTVLHRSHLPLKVWFLAAWLVATHRNGISARQLWLQLGLGSYKTAWLLLQKLRRAPMDLFWDRPGSITACRLGRGRRNQHALSYGGHTDQPETRALARGQDDDRRRRGDP